jgi:hypothetical protein
MQIIAPTRPMEEASVNNTNDKLDGRHGGKRRLSVQWLTPLA